jgi:hypothetical protein
MAMNLTTYPDGSTIELGWGNTHPPGWTGQHGNVSRTWVRMNGGEWARSESRSDHAARVLIGAAENAVEAFEAITG